MDNIYYRKIRRQNQQIGKIDRSLLKVTFDIIFLLSDVCVRANTNPKVRHNARGRALRGPRALDSPV